MTQPKATVVDEITRIYKNTDGKVIGLHSISITELRKQIPDPSPGKVNNDRFKRTAKMSYSFTRFNLDMTGSREVTEVLMLGKYDDYLMNLDGTDIIEVSYIGNEETNDIKIDLRQFPTIGDTL